MIRDHQGKLKIEGPYTFLGNVYEYIPREEILMAVVEGKLSLSIWDETTTLEKKLADLSETKRRLLSSELEKYISTREKTRQNADLGVVLTAIARLEERLTNLTIAFTELAKGQDRMREKMSDPQFVGLKEIAESFEYEGRFFYSVGSLRNKIKSEIIGEMEVGYLDVFNFHLILLKKGKRWVTPYAHFLEERRKIDYDFVQKLKKNSTDVKDVTSNQKRCEKAPKCLNKDSSR